MKTILVSTTLLLSLLATSVRAQTVATCRVLDDYIPVGQRFPTGSEPGWIKGNTPGSQVNVRTGPGSEFEADAYGLVGDSIQVTGQAFSAQCETWFQVRFPISGHIGWIHGDFIELYYGRGWWD